MTAQAPSVQQAEHRTEGLSDWTHWRWKELTGWFWQHPQQHWAGQTHCSPSAATEDSTLLSPTDGRHSVQWVLRRCAQQLSLPSLQSFHVLPGNQKEKPGSEAAICYFPVHRTHLCEKQLPARLVFLHSAFQALAKSALFSVIQ